MFINWRADGSKTNKDECISIPLIITMVVAIVTVHLSNGFEAGNNGFEIPLYYMLMLFALLINGAGKLSVDHIISNQSK